MAGKAYGRPDRFADPRSIMSIWIECAIILAAIAAKAWLAYSLGRD